MNKKRTSVFLTITAFILVVTITGVSFAWFLSLDASEKNTKMGVVDISINQIEHNITTANPVIEFELTSQSNIDYFVKMGTTLIFKDGSGEEITKNIPDDLLDIKVTYLSAGGDTLNINNTAYTTFMSHGYEKKGIEMVDGDGKYIVFQHEKNQIKGRIEITFNTAKYGSYFSGGVPNDNLYITLIPEAIQGTKKAVSNIDVKNAGWKVEKVFNEARTIVDDSVIKN